MRVGKSLLRWSVLYFYAVVFSMTAFGTCSHEFISTDTPATCTAPGMHEEYCRFCGEPGNVYHSEPPLGHDYSVFEVMTDPGCESEGEGRYLCSRCGIAGKRELIPELGHDFPEEWTVEEPAVCGKSGKAIKICRRCLKQEIQVLPALEHIYDQGKVTKEPTRTAYGKRTYTCTLCGNTYEQTIDKLHNPFLDVESEDYFCDSVLWAVYHRITTGIDPLHFMPDQTCSRAQAMTFLWRAMGTPDPDSEENPFLDIVPESYYETAVLWAYYAGITTGKDIYHFAPDDPCSRSQVVTFLYRLYAPEQLYASNPFWDVGQQDYFHQPVLWAVAHGITMGMDDRHFAPDDACNRGQIVTFIYRAEHCFS